MKYIATHGFVQGLQNPLKIPGGSKYVPKGMIFEIDDKQIANKDMHTFINLGHLIPQDSDRGKEIQAEVATNDNIRTLPTGRIESILKNNPIGSPMSVSLYDELKRRDELEAAVGSAEDLLAQNAIHHANVLTQNQTHHESVLNQNEKHHGDMLTQFQHANQQIHRAHTLSKLALFISTIAVLISGILPVWLDHQFTKDQPPSNILDPTKAPQMPSHQGINKLAEAANPLPISEPTVTTNLPTQKSQTTPQWTN